MTRNFKLVGLECAHCAAKMEAKIQKIRGVSKASINFMTTKLSLEYDDDSVLPLVEEAVKSVDSKVKVK